MKSKLARPSSLTFLQRYWVPLLLAVLCFAFVTRMFRLSTPSTYVFDEVYHGITSKLIARNDPRAFEWTHGAIEPNTAIDWLHPPLAKYTQALSMVAFGENSFGWRFSSVVFGVLVVAMTFWLAQELFEDEAISLLAAVLASLDGLLLVLSRIAMNDIHVTFFILAALSLYWKFRKEWILWSHQLPSSSPTINMLAFKQTHRWLVLSGLVGGLALSSKWSGLFVILIMGAAEAGRFLQLGLRLPVMQRLLNPGAQLVAKKTSQRTRAFYIPSLPEVTQFVALTAFSLVVLPLSVYLSSYSLMFLQGKSLFCFEDHVIEGRCYLKVVTHPDGSTTQTYISHFHELHDQIWWYQTNLKATHDFQSRPYQWFLNLRPVWFHITTGKDTVANIYAQGNPLLFWLGAACAIGSTLFFVMLFFGQSLMQISTKLTTQLAPLGFLLFSYFMVWLPWQFSPRIMFFYHYTPAVPLLSILCSFWLMKLWSVKYMKEPVGALVVTAVVALIAITFAIWYPNWTALPVPTAWAEAVYFSLPSWK